MPTVKKLQFANGTNITPPADLTLETAVKSLPTFVDDAAYAAFPGNVVGEGSIYLNTTLNALRMYLAGAWRTGINQENAADSTKKVVLDTDDATTGVTHTLDFNGTVDRTYTFPDVAATVVLTLSAQDLEDKTLINGFLDGTKIKNGKLDVDAEGGLKIAENMGPHTLILGGVNSAVVVPGSLVVEGVTTTVDTINLDVKDKNITINKNGNDASSEGAGLTIDRTGTNGSFIYKDTAPNKFAAGALGSEKNLASIDGSEILLNKRVSSTGNMTGALVLPVGNTNDRTGLGTQGMVRYNTTLATFEGHNGIDWGSIGGGGGSAGGTVVTVPQVGHGFSVGDAVYLNGSTYAKAIATSAAAAEVVGVVSKADLPDEFDLTLSGELTGLTGLTTGEVYFLSADTAGALTVTEPSVIGQVSVPVGVASSTSSMYVAPKRGVVVGGVNARTEVALTSGAVTNVQDVAGMTAGELEGWVFISSASPVRFYISAKFALSGAGGDYNLSYQTSGDTPPAGFLVDITSAGMIRVTLPAASGTTSVINYALNAPAIGASFPLTVNADTILSGTVDDERLPDPTTYSDAKATKLGLKQYVNGVAYNSGNTITLTGSGVAVRRAVFVPYQVQDGSWRLKFNLAITCTSTTDLALSISGILSKNSSNFFQALSPFPGGNYGRSYIVPNSNTITMTSDLSTNSFSTSGDIELESKPTWAY